MQAGIYATPIIYPLSLVIDKSQLAAKLMLLNPVAQVIQDARYLVITTHTDTLSKLTDNWLALLFPLAVVLVTILGAVYYFRKSSKYFAEIV